MCVKCDCILFVYRANAGVSWLLSSFTKWFIQAKKKAKQLVLIRAVFLLVFHSVVILICIYKWSLVTFSSFTQDAFLSLYLFMIIDYVECQCWNCGVSLTLWKMLVKDWLLVTGMFVFVTLCCLLARWEFNWMWIGPLFIIYLCCRVVEPNYKTWGILKDNVETKSVHELISVFMFLSIWLLDSV